MVRAEFRMRFRANDLFYLPIKLLAPASKWRRGGEILSAENEVTISYWKLRRSLERHIALDKLIVVKSA